MFIQKINNALDSFKTLLTTSAKKEAANNLFLDEEFSIAHESKFQEYQEEEFAKRQTLNYALVNRIDQRLTREMRFAICKDILKHMYDFRIAHFSSREEAFDLNAFDFATETVNFLSKWLDEQYENGGDFFEISAYSDEDGFSGSYNCETGGNSPLFINCVGSSVKRFQTINVGGKLEHTIYHELTHLLQDVFRCKSGTKVDHEDYGKTWENRWTEREAIYCSNKALSHRLYPLVYSDFENRVISEYTSFDFDKYIETAMFLKELSSFAAEFSVSDLKFDNDETELSESMAT